MGVYKKALVKYINRIEEEQVRHIFWKLFDGLLDRNNKEECAALVSYLAEVVEDEN